MFPPICKLISTSYTQSIVANSIHVINMLLETNAEIVINNMGDYLNVLLDIGSKVMVQNNKTSNSPSNMKVKWRVIQGITSVMEQNIDLIIAKFQDVCQLMHIALMHKDQ